MFLQSLLSETVHQLLFYIILILLRRMATTTEEGRIASALRPALSILSSRPARATWWVLSVCILGRELVEKTVVFFFFNWMSLDLSFSFHAQGIGRAQGTGHAQGTGILGRRGCLLCHCITLGNTCINLCHCWGSWHWLSLILLSAEKSSFFLCH